MIYNRMNVQIIKTDDFESFQRSCSEISFEFAPAVSIFAFNFKYVICKPLEC